MSQPQRNPAASTQDKLFIDYALLGERHGVEQGLAFQQLGTGRGMEFLELWRNGEHKLFLERLSFLMSLGATVEDVTVFTYAAQASLHRTLEEAERDRVRTALDMADDSIVPPHSTSLQ